MDLDDSNVSFFDLSQGLTSTPTTSTPTSRRSRSTNARSGVFKVPSKPKTRKAPIVGMCHICGKEYARKKSLDDHMRLHALTDANSRYPDESKLREAAPQIIESTLKKLAAINCVGEWGPQHNSFVQDLLSTFQMPKKVSDLILDRFIHGLCSSKKFLLPAVLLPIVHKVSDEILTSAALRNEVAEELLNLNPANDKAMVDCFVCDYVDVFGEEIVSFICKSVVGARQIKVNRPHHVFDIEDRQTIFYVAGSDIKGFLRKAWRYRKNPDYASIKETIETRIREGDGVTGVPRAAQADRAWTEAQNRKSLFFIGAPAMDFFVALAHVLYNIESDEKGNFSDNEVMKDVFEDSVCILLWDELIGTSLNSDLAIRFLKGVVKSFTQTYGRGVAQKKLNSHLKKAFIAMNLRFAVAPRQK